MLCSIVQNDVILYSIVQNNIMLCSIAQNDVIRYSIVQNNAIW